MKRKNVGESYSYEGLKKTYTEEELTKAFEEGKLYFFDIVHSCSCCGIDHEGYSNCYADINELVKDAYDFMKKHKEKMGPSKRYIQIRGITDSVANYSLNRHIAILGCINLWNIGPSDKIIFNLERNFDPDMGRFKELYDTLDNFKELSDDNLVIQKKLKK